MQYTIEFKYTTSLKSKNVGTPNVFTFTILRIVLTLDVFYIYENFAVAKNARKFRSEIACNL